MRLYEKKQTIGWKKEKQNNLFSGNNSIAKRQGKPFIRPE